MAQKFRLKLVGLAFSLIAISSVYADGEQSKASVKPMKFFLFVGMDAVDGDMVNPVCVSNVITKVGQRNWNNEDVNRTIEANYKLAFIEKCRAYRRIRDGQDIPQYVSNQYESDAGLEDVWASNKERPGAFLVTLP